MDYYEQIEEAADALRQHGAAADAVAVVLGSGLNGFAAHLDRPVSTPYTALPNWPPSATAGHDGRVVLGSVRGRSVIALAGRSHMYEGLGAAAVTFPVRVLGVLGVRSVLLTNAAGGIASRLTPGSLMIIDDHVNLMGASPLAGFNDERFGPRFPDLSQVYSPRLRALADRAGQVAGVPLMHGIYGAVPGPNYETPAEVRYLRTIGVDAVGMSTVPEAIVARHMGLEVLGISCISNMAAGLAATPLDHADVIETAGGALGRLSAVLEEVIGQL